MSIQWTDDLSVKVKEIDAQHQTLLTLVESLLSMTKAGAKGELVNIARQIEGYLNFHFATEEKYFDKFDYEWAEEHKKSHQDLVRSIARFKRRDEEEDDYCLAENAELIGEELKEHLQEEDQRYIQCFNKNGLD